MFKLWRQSLILLSAWFDKQNAEKRYFSLRLFGFFMIVNFLCFWAALLITYPEYLRGHKAIEYQIMSFPVALLGALFDTFSLYVTVALIRHALKTKNNVVYVTLLSVDLVIAALAGLWVLFVFIASGWIVSFALNIPETLAYRTTLYEGRMGDLLLNPFSEQNIKNFSFGIIMGGSALLPTLVHAFIAFCAVAKAVLERLRSLSFIRSTHLLVFSRLIFGACVILIAAGSLSPTLAPMPLSDSDKFIHFIAYAFLTLLGIFAFYGQHLKMAVWIFCYGALIEVLQNFIPGRDMSLLDAIANGFGVMIVTIAALFAHKLDRDAAI